MKRLMLLIVLGLSAGGQSTPHPSPGMAALRVNVVAGPKAGAKQPSEAVSVYDYGPSTPSYGTGAFERVNYSALDEIVVWVEPAGAAQTATQAAATIDVDAGKPSRGLDRAVAVGQRIIVRNRGAQAADFYSLADGNEF